MVDSRAAFFHLAMPKMLIRTSRDSVATVPLPLPHGRAGRGRLASWAVALGTGSSARRSPVPTVPAPATPLPPGLRSPAGAGCRPVVPPALLLPWPPPHTYPGSPPALSSRDGQTESRSTLHPQKSILFYRFLHVPRFEVQVFALLAAFWLMSPFH